MAVYSGVTPHLSLLGVNNVQFLNIRCIKKFIRAFRVKHGRDGKASSKTDDTAPFPKGLLEDLEKLRTALLSDMTQVVHSLLKTELAGALSPVNMTFEQVKSYYKAHDEHLRKKCYSKI